MFLSENKEPETATVPKIYMENILDPICSLHLERTSCLYKHMDLYSKDLWILLIVSQGTVPICGTHE